MERDQELHMPTAESRLTLLLLCLGAGGRVLCTTGEGHPPVVRGPE